MAFSKAEWLDNSRYLPDICIFRTTGSMQRLAMLVVLDHSHGCCRRLSLCRVSPQVSPGCQKRRAAELRRQTRTKDLQWLERELQKASIHSPRAFFATISDGDSGESASYCHVNL